MRMKLSSLALLTLFLAAVLASCSSKSSTTTASSDSSAAASPQDKLARGTYLVTVAGCNDCHTPGTHYGAPDMSRMLSGSEVGWTGPWGTSYAANLTPDSSTGLGNYTEDDLVTAFRTGHKKDGAPILPPMPWPDFAYFTDEDAYAIAAFLKSVPPVVHAVPKNLPPGKKAQAAIVIPPPSAWDAPKTPPPGAAPSDTTHS
jgi:mono/diheme cytochrome c family protein